MKKLCSLLLCLVLVFSLAACGSTEPPEPTAAPVETDTASNEVIETVAPTEPPAVSATDDETEAAVAIKFFLQPRFHNPDTFQIIGDIVVFNLPDNITVYCVPFAVEDDKGDYIAPLMAEISTNGTDTIMALDGEENFKGWVQANFNDEVLSSLGMSRNKINGAAVAKIAGVEYVENLLAQEEITASFGNDAIEDSVSVPVFTELSAGPLVLKEYGYYESYGALYTTAVLYNAGDKLITVPSFRVTARDANGALLGTGDCMAGRLYPGQTYVYSSYVCSLDEPAAVVECIPLEPSEFDLLELAGLNYPTYTPLEVINVALRSDKFVGEIVNSNDYAIDFFSISITFRDADGNICGGFTDYKNALPANSTIPWEFTPWDSFNYASYEVTANFV